jgi:hypothetical protein
MNGFTKLQTFHVVVHSFDISSWQVAMDEEYASLLKNGTWELMPLPQGKNVHCKWVYKFKYK